MMVPCRLAARGTRAKCLRMEQNKGNRGKKRKGQTVEHKWDNTGTVRSSRRVTKLPEFSYFLNYHSKLDPKLALPIHIT